MDQLIFDFLAKAVLFYRLLSGEARAYLERTQDCRDYRLALLRNKNRLRVYKKNGKKRQYIPSSKTSPERMQTIQIRFFMKRLAHVCEDNIRALQTCIDSLRTIDPAQILQSLPDSYKCPPEVLYSALGWDAGTCTLITDPDYYPEGRIFKTLSGISVRSKSEMLIADALYALGIRFVYEPCITINGTIYHPDFAIFMPYTGRVVLWEHFGLMDSKDYQWKVIRKLQDYIMAGYLPGYDLIMTFEDKERKLSSKEVAAIIEHWFLRE